ncbi:MULTISPECIES: ABC transporter ATP-binding protein [unclassified Beijerinckia]|uniref:ABC transporter ATP-binding protein n=1 Tax=unclassified Beijerinckia TaxID=2638183 RepID=UPI0008998D9B|nr:MULTISPECIES: ABC transporter ATP-binding protein [unclassified Beijerinckia]MDH7799122.1 NitT/TauT family transport system ATP-binding protein [Beijerinckia sp. GAS462]SED94381.1 NitT/TauT family transport system ATP-binding protein [Beijerinckia sp. 28-YEA-48]
MLAVDNKTKALISDKAAINIRGLHKSFSSDVVALEDIDLSIPERQFVSIIGPSGCGKSTLLRILAGLLPWDTGTVELDGGSVSEASTSVGVVFQSSNMLPWLSVRDNVALGAKIRGISTGPNGQIVDDMLKLLSLDKFAKSYPHQLSGGMRQRAAIGQALVLNPKILLMDEPFGALDALTRDRLNVELLRIWQEQMKTVVLITHSISEAVFLSDRVVVMSPHPGKIIEEIEIDLPRPRQPDATRLNPLFGQYVTTLSKIMGVT